MKTIWRALRFVMWQNRRNPSPRLSCRLRCSAAIVVLLVIIALLAMGSSGWTQYPPGLQPLQLTGATVGASLRNAAAATTTQLGVVRNYADAWGHRASSGIYRDDQLQQDFANMQFQFQALRQQFNAMGSIALQLGRPRANNAVAELDSGLNVIAELFTFLQNQYSAGTLNRQTIVRTCQSFEAALVEWGRELKADSSRMGFVW